MHVNETDFDLNLKIIALSTTTLLYFQSINFDIVGQTRILKHK